MATISEEAVYAALQRCSGSARLHLGEGEATASLSVQDNRVRDSPDFVLWLEVELRVFGQKVRVRVPIPIEAEKGGIKGGALEDLKKFAQRQRHRLELPMLVVAGSRHDHAAQTICLATDVAVRQVPGRFVEEVNRE